MNRNISQLLNSVASSFSIEEQQQALFQIAMLLEKNTRPSDESGFYESVLPSEILDIHLTGKLQAEILKELISHDYSQALLPSVLWAIGKALPSVAAPILSKILKSLPDLPNDPQAAYQAAISLENCLDYDRKERDFDDVQGAVRTPPVLECMTLAASSSDKKLAKRAKLVLKRLDS